MTMSGRKALCLGLGIALGLLWAPLALRAQSPNLKGAITGTPALKSIQAIGFGPNGLLLIGDGRGAQVIAVDTGDTKATKWTTKKRPNINEELAGRLGTTAKGIEIVKIAVNPASQTAYFAIRVLDGKKDLILTMDGDGKVREFPLEKVRFVRIELPVEDKSPMKMITDIAWADDQVLVAAQANETFASKIITIATPLQHESKGTVASTETYHVAHGRWETNAPIRTILPYEENGKKYLVGAFTCTPLVKYSLTELRPGARVKGTSVIELGNGNTPRGMFTYQKDGKTYILMNTYRMFHKRDPVGPSPYWTVKVDQTILQEAEKVNQKALRRVKGKASVSMTDRAVVVPEYHGVVLMDRFDAQNALVVRTDDKGAMDLAVLPLP
jgi:hypothetical protein